MNPFDLRGPEFLLFYIVFAAAVIGLAVLLRRVFESGPVPKLGEVDPYLVAYLRGGPNEAVRVAIISLCDRGLLKSQGLTPEGQLLQSQKDAVERVHRPIEREILDEFSVATPVSSIFSKSGPRAACDALARELTRRGLLPTSNQVLERVLIGLLAVAILWWVAFTKIEIALSRGRHNIQFLVLVAFAASIQVVFAFRSRTTALGKRVLQDFRTLFSQLRDRTGEIRAGGATNELALLAGVFGPGALTGAALALSEALFPKWIKVRPGDSGWSTSSAWDISCGLSSCGSSSGSSCGSSCGGGCGGGCGGCGS